MLEIKGNTYGFLPTYVMLAGYIYNNSIINRNAFILGSKATIGTIDAFSLDGKLCFWFHYYSYWQGFSFKCSKVTSERNEENHVVTVLNSAIPSSAIQKVSITPCNFWNADNLSFSYSGGTLTITT